MISTAKSGFQVALSSRTWKAWRQNLVTYCEMTGEQVFSSSTLEFRAFFADSKSSYVRFYRHACKTLSFLPEGAIAVGDNG